MRRIFVDFEMHPISKEYIEERKICRREIIEFGAVMLDEQCNEISSFKEYVKPQYVRELYGRVVALTGITTAKLSGAQHFNEVFYDFLSWCNSFDEDFVVYAWSESDLAQLAKEMELKKTVQSESVDRLLSNWTDFQKEYCELVKSKQMLSLEKAMNVIGKRYMGNMHDSLWDARNTAELFAVSADRDEFFRQLKPITEALSNPKKEISTFSLGEIFNFETCNLALT